MSPIQASYHALSEGSSVHTAATLPPAQPNSNTLTPSGLTSLVSPEAASIRKSRRQCAAGRKTFGSSSSAPASLIFVAVCAPARSEPRSAASTSSERLSGDHWMSSTEPEMAPSSPRPSIHTLMRPAWPRSEAYASVPSGANRGSASAAPASVASAPSIQSLECSVWPFSRNDGDTMYASRLPSAETARSTGRRSCMISSGVTFTASGAAARTSRSYSA